MVTLKQRYIILLLFHLQIGVVFSVFSHIHVTLSSILFILMRLCLQIEDEGHSDFLLPYCHFAFLIVMRGNKILYFRIFVATSFETANEILQADSNWR